MTAGPDRPLRVLVCGHGAERTGPPVYLQRVASWMARRDDVQLEILLLDDGPLLGDLRALAPVTVLPEFRIGGRARYVPAIAGRLGGPAAQQRGREAVLRPRVKHLPSPDVVYINTASSIRALRYLDFRPRCVVTHVHEMSLGLERYLRPEDRALIEATTDRYLAVSTPVRDHLVERWGVAPERVGHAAGVVHVPPAAPTVPAAELRRRLDVADSDVLVGSAGTVDWRKAPDLFLALAARLVSRPGSRVHLVWIGGGAGSPAWAAAHSSLALAGLEGRVSFVGEQDQPLDWLRALDVFVLPSREDAYPLVCLEAASVGVPVVCFDTGGMVDFLTPPGGPSCGVVVQYPDVSALAAAVGALVDDAPERARLGALGQQRVAQQHAVEVGSRQLLDELQAAGSAAPRG